MGGFQRFPVDFRVPGTKLCSSGRVKNMIILRQRARQKVLDSDARFHHVAGFPALR